MLRVLCIAYFIGAFWAAKLPDVEDESDDADEIIDLGAGQADTNEYPNADDEFEDDGFEVLHHETNIQSDEGAPIDDEDEDILGGHEVFNLMSEI